jgi:hypothetical protein
METFISVIETCSFSAGARRMKVLFANDIDDVGRRGVAHHS